MVLRSGALTMGNRFFVSPTGVEVTRRVAALYGDDYQRSEAHKTSPKPRHATHTAVHSIQLYTLTTHHIRLLPLGPVPL